MTAAILALCLLLAGCAVSPKNIYLKPEDTQVWRGRLAVRVDTPQPQSVSAGFELTGTADSGEMTLFTPLGGTAAVLSWSAHSATMRVNGQIQQFESLSKLINEALGTEIPVSALFAWLAGETTTTAGWSPDLSQHSYGRITAKRITPGPTVELRVLLDNQ